MNALITDIYKETNFEGIMVNNINYYELDNMWSQRDENLHPLKDNEKDNKCDKYMIDYYNDDCDEDEYCDIDSDSIPTHANWKFLINYGNYSDNINQPLFSNKTSILLVNQSGINWDHRGADHFHYLMPYKDEIWLHNPTLGEFSNALYMIKSHKVDKWYELYHSCHVQSYASPSSTLLIDDIDKEDIKDFRIKINFDHGS